ncbi:uncharacterized protein EV154DRAFT_478823 [Mucor mucedo]|uniref:uncharacterized protein n=1 Tax=Mucor mucedo TaxID=29922 RepID=UPI00221E9FCA|nr:uncharacterized protein EV154DRAFT_478823 [Mucor mucedo]KAI7894029.1 hypothetical protein EV154DRAFT_478823 [Mucor mucedo]
MNQFLIGAILLPPIILEIMGGGECGSTSAKAFFKFLNRRAGWEMMVDEVLFHIFVFYFKIDIGQLFGLLMLHFTLKSLFLSFTVLLGCHSVSYGLPVISFPRRKR